MKVISGIQKSAMRLAHKIDLNFFCELFIFTFILLVACPITGQANNKLSPFDSPIKVHQDKNSVVFELDRTLLNKDMLFVSHNQGYKNVIWTRYGSDIILQEKSVTSLSGVTIPLNNDPSQLSSVIAVFPVIENNTKPYSIYFDVTTVFAKHIDIWNSETSSERLENSPIIKSVTYLKDEIIFEIQRLHINGQTKTKTLKTEYYSFYLLPEPMHPRAFDYRVGYFVEDELSSVNHGVENAKGNISKWRLEKENPTEKLSNPVKPITFYLDTTIPPKFKSYVKAGVLEWERAFREAGFKNAIEVKEIPDDKTRFSMNSVNHSIIRWNDDSHIRGSEKSKGSSISKIVDFRSGEILKSDLILKIGYQGLADDYFIRCSPIDIRAQQFPFPKDLMGALIQFIVAHETGHALGLRDGNYGEYTYPFNKMRNNDWLKEMGHTPSVMNYARHNYLAQPEDIIDPSLLIQSVGPTDMYSIKWGYQSFTSDVNTYSESHYLKELIRQQQTVPWYQFNMGQYETIGPQYVNEVADNNNPIKSAALGLKNMQKVIELIPQVSSLENDNAQTERLYKKTLAFWEDQLLHVASLIGGYKIAYNFDKNLIPLAKPIPLSKQQEALDFLLSNAFYQTKWLGAPYFIEDSKYSVGSDKLNQHQINVLNTLLTPLRLKRLEQMETIESFENITAMTMGKLSDGIWQELTHKKVKIEAYRQELQITYIHLLIDAITQEKNYKVTFSEAKYFESTDYIRGILMANLIGLEKKIENCMKNIQNEATYGHLNICLFRIRAFQK